MTNLPMSVTHKTVHAYVRLCRDSGFKLDFVQAAILTGKMLGIHPLQVWCDIGSLDTMVRVANGLHPAAHNREAYP